MKANTRTKRLFFYWTSSFIIASSMYYFLWWIMPYHYVFGALFLFKSSFYHWEFPLEYILIPCFFYGIIASVLAGKFRSSALIGRVCMTIFILVLTIAVSSPFGGMLWFYHDMEAGYFPANWIFKIINKGISQGIEKGWIVVILSAPYNILGAIVCYFLTKKGTELFNTKAYST